MCICTYDFIVVNSFTPVNKHEETSYQILYKDRSLLLGSILITEQVETLCQITIRIETDFLVRS